MEIWMAVGLHHHCRVVVFTAIFDNSMKEQLEGKMEIVDFNAATVEEFLEYMYTGIIPDSKNAMDLFAIAVKYDVTQLKTTCEEMVIENLVLALAHLYSADDMKKIAFDVFKQIFPRKQLPDELKNQPEKLKKLVIADQNRKQMIKNAEAAFAEIYNNL